MRNDYYVKKAYNSALELHDLGQQTGVHMLKQY